MSETPLKQNFFERNIKLIYFHILKLLTPLLILISPGIMSWLTHFNSNYRRLPAVKEKIFMKEDPLDEFIFHSEIQKKFDEVNIIMRGEYYENINTTIPTFFINTYSSKKNFPNHYYATTDRLMFKAMMGEPENEFLKCFNYDDPNKSFFYFMPIGPLIENIELNKQQKDFKTSLIKISSIKKTLGYKNDYSLCVCCHAFKGYNIQIGSGIISIISLLKLSNKVNVYGWDSFLNETLPSTYYSQTHKLWSDFSEFQPISRFSAIVLNWIYAHRLINYFSSNRLVVHGKVKEVSKLDWVEKYLYKMMKI